jgi:hypothetical protein
MKPFLRALSVLAFVTTIAVATTAFALEANGMITGVDIAGATITLSSGQTFKLSDAELFKTIKLGDRVFVEYMMDGSTMVATAIHVAI